MKKLCALVLLMAASDIVAGDKYLSAHVALLAATMSIMQDSKQDTISQHIRRPATVSDFGITPKYTTVSQGRGSVPNNHHRSSRAGGHGNHRKTRKPQPK